MIRHNGLAFPCCQLNPVPENAIGNINTQSLSEIANGERVRAMRKQSLEGRLPCYDTCDQVKYYCKNPIPRPDSLDARVEDYRELQIEYGELCNVDCIMCWQDRNNRVMLDYETLLKNLPIDPWTWVNVYGGEIFVMKDAWRHVQLLMQAGKNILITTNGKSLSNPELARFIVSHSWAITISVNAVTEETHTKVMRPKVPFFHQLLESLQRLRVLREEVGRPTFLINGHFVVVKESLYEWPLFIEKFAEMGFDEATIGFDHRHFPAYFDEHPEIVADLSRRVRAALEKIGGENAKRVTIADHGRFVNSQ